MSLWNASVVCKTNPDFLGCSPRTGRIWQSRIRTWAAFIMVLIVERSSEGETKQNKVRGINISKDPLLGEGPFAEVEVQAGYDEDIMPLGSHKVLG